MPVLPTILIGYGSYGMTILRRFLSAASERGSLIWEDPPGAQGPGARRLRDFSLILAPDYTGADPPLDDGDLSRDLYRQIYELRPSGSAERGLWSAADEIQALTDRAVAERNRLLQAAGPWAAQERSRNGLDVFVFARPSGAEVMGALEDLLPPCMDALANDPSLRSLAQGAERLNFVQFFDFENYWDRTPEGRALRQETRLLVERCQERVRSGKPGFGRIYFSQAHGSHGGYRDENLRMEETILFLELLLFEGLRDVEAVRRFYQRDADDRTLLASFSVRCMERSRGLLSRLVAARFAYGWLDYLCGDRAASGTEARESMRSRLSRYRPDGLDLTGERAELERRTEAGLNTVESELKLLRPEEDNWPEAVREAALQATLRVKQELAGWVGERTRHIAAPYLEGLRENIRHAITASLHDQTSPVTVGGAIAELRSLQAQLRNFSPPPVQPEAKRDGFAATDEIHRRYRLFRWAQISIEGLLGWWPLLAVITAVAWTPILLEAVGSLATPGPDATEAWRTTHAALQTAAKPPSVALLLLALAWLAGSRIFHKAASKRAERGTLAYTHPETGMVAGALRSALTNGGLRASIREYAGGIFQTMVLRIRGEVLRELNRAIGLLTERQREMQWLRTRLREFLRSHGVDANHPEPAFDRPAAQSTYRFSIERDEDLRRLLALNPASSERFESTQSGREPFPQWDQKFCDTFLYPLDFLEDLSLHYQEAAALRNDGSRSQDDRAADFRRFMQAYEGFGPSMVWSAEQGAPAIVPENFCVIPNAWFALPGVAAGLSGRDFTEQKTLPAAGPDRCYLVRMQLGVPPDRLLDEEDR